MQMTLNNHVVSFNPGENYLDILKHHDPLCRALGIRVGGNTLPLTALPVSGENAAALTLADLEGRMIYERSLRFIFLLAVHRLYPTRRVRIEHSLGNGVYCEVRGDKKALTSAEVAAIKREMRAIVSADLPFVCHTLSKREGIAFFEKNGDLDKVELL